MVHTLQDQILLHYTVSSLAIFMEDEAKQNCFKTKQSNCFSIVTGDVRFKGKSHLGSPYKNRTG